MDQITRKKLDAGELVQYGFFLESDTDADREQMLVELHAGLDELLESASKDYGKPLKKVDVSVKEGYDSKGFFISISAFFTKA